MKKLIGVLLLALCSAGLLLAQPNQGHRKNLKPDPETMAQLHEYINSEMVPVLRSAQQALDQSLPSSDLTLLKSLRVEAVQVKLEGMKMHGKRSKSHKEDQSNQKDHSLRHQEMKAHYDQMKALVSKLQPIMERHGELIQKTMSELKPNYEKWTSDQKQILGITPEKQVQKEKGKREIELFGIRPHRQFKGKGNSKRHAKGQNARADETRGDRPLKGRKPNHPDRLTHQFLLWDGAAPAMPTPRRVTQAREDKSLGVEGRNLDMQIHPNPVQSFIQVSFDLPSDQDSGLILIYDNGGKLVKEQALNNLVAGPAKTSVDLSDQANGVYFLKLVIGTQNSSKQFVIRK